MGDKDTRDAALINSMAEKSSEGEKEETRNRMNELTTFALAVFGFSKVHIGTGAHNRERKATATRHSVTERDALRGTGIRPPFGNRICQRSASLAWGTLGDSHVDGDLLWLSDFYPFEQTNYEAFDIFGRKMASRNKQPTTIDYFSKCAKQHIAIWCWFFGEEHKEAITSAMSTLWRLHETHPELFTIGVLVSISGGNDVPLCRRDERRNARNGAYFPVAVRKGEFRMKSLTPMPDGRTRWEYHTVFLTTHPTGYWATIAVPNL